jgi:hypothetical protein
MGEKKVRKRELICIIRIRDLNGYNICCVAQALDLTLSHHPSQTQLK